MATLLGTDTYAGQVSALQGAKPDGQKTRGDISSFEGQYTFLGTENSGDVLPIINLPAGAILHPDSIRVISEGIGGTGVVFNKIGDAGDDDRYSATNVALTAAGIVTVTPTNAIMLNPYVIEEANRTILAALSGTLPATAGKKITFRGIYRMP